MQDYIVDVRRDWTVLDALVFIRETIDPTLICDHVCGNGICGSCAMLVNLRPALACRTLILPLPFSITLHPLPFFNMLGDLSVDTSVYFATDRSRSAFWIHSNLKDEIEHYRNIRFDNNTMLRIHELERCIECGCCIASCPTAELNAGFAGPYTLLTVSRFLLDPRDHRPVKDWYTVYGTDNGIFGCTSVLACDAVCPKGIPLAAALSRVRKQLLFAGVRKK